MIFNMGGGGNSGGIELNFKVVGGTSAPSSPIENTIWINTSAEITGWRFCAKDPFEFKIASNAGDIVGTAGGITFKKKNAGKSIFTFVRDGTYTIPIMVSDSHEAAMLTSSSGAEFDSYAFTYKGKTWYNSFLGFGLDLWDTATPKITSMTDIQIIGVYLIDMFEKAEGFAWISTGIVSSKEFNGLKENGIQIYPLSVKQYINSNWVNKIAQIYQNGSWGPLIFHLFDNGNQCKDVTGGWIGDQATDNGKYNIINLSPYWINGGHAGVSNGYLRVGAAMVSGYGGYGAACISTKNKIDLTSINKIVVQGSVSGSTTYTKIGVTSNNSIWNSSGYWNCAAYTALQNGTTTLDVSGLSGSYYIVFGSHTGDDGNSAYLAVNEVIIQ